MNFICLIKMKGFFSNVYDKNNLLKKGGNPNVARKEDY